MQWNELLSTNRCFENLFHNPLQDEGHVFEADYHRIIGSAIFRRLQDKAQVFPLDADDYIRTRLTHSLEVSSIGNLLGESIFQKLKSNEKDPYFINHSSKSICDILLCAGLIHDIGNPPFGHFGEYAIREWFKNNLINYSFKGKKITECLSQEMLEDLYNFEGNAQALRILSKSPYLGDVHGLNLTFAVLASIIKYPVSSVNINDSTAKIQYKKMGYYQAEKDLFYDIAEKTGMRGNRHPLSFILEAADDIAYKSSDIEDAIVKNILSYEQLISSLYDYANLSISDLEMKEEFISYIKLLEEEYALAFQNKGRKPALVAVQKWNLKIQTLLINCATECFLENYEAIMSGTFGEDLFFNTLGHYIASAISFISETYIYTSKAKIKVELYGKKIIQSLLEQFIPAAIVYDTPYIETFIDKRIMNVLSNFYKSSYLEQAKDKDENEKLYLRLLMTTDFISGMTDRYAKQLYQEIL